MAWFAVALPWITGALGAAGAWQQGQQAKVASRMMMDQARSEAGATARDEEQVRRESRMQLGRQIAAVGEAGGGYEGSAGLLLDQSAILAELDALNVRNGGAMRRGGLMLEAAGLRQSSRSAGLLAGARLLTGASDAYTSNRLVK